MQPTDIPLYLDWTFWAFISSAAAIFLSQMPPVRLWWKQARLDLEIYSRIHITHKIGNPNLQIHLILSNIGGRTVKIKNIIAEIERDGTKIGSLPAQNYLLNPNDKNTVLLTSFSLAPEKEVAHTVNFLNYFSRGDAKKYSDAESNLVADIREKRSKLSDEKLVEADTKFVDPFIEMYRNLFIWKSGDYKLSIKVLTSNNKTNIKKEYRFTLFESDSSELSKYVDCYKYGDGIKWDSGNNPGVVVQIIEL